LKHGPRYWDSTCFLCWLKDEPDKETCNGVVEAAKKGEVLIVTSALTLAEVIKLKHKVPIPQEDAERVKEFFERHDVIEVRQVDRRIAEEARQLVWNYGTEPKDAIHLATALRYHITVFDTLDGPLIKLNGKLGNPPMRIGKPDIEYQEEIFGDQGRKLALEFRKRLLLRKFEPISFQENILFRKFEPLS
jgi:predicted nucleic acid-binding protein